MTFQLILHQHKKCHKIIVIIKAYLMMLKLNLLHFLGNEMKPGLDTEENRWNHYNEFIFFRN